MSFDLLTIFGFFASIVIGISLGLIGGGGSILTVPVLVYLFRIDPILATAYSLFIVGSSSLIGAVPKYKAGLIDIKTVLVFGFPSIIAVFFTRKILVPALPEVLFAVGDFHFSKALGMMLLFAILMVAASVSMIRDQQNEEQIADQVRVFNYPMILLEGAIVGVLTGLVGAGGGFLIIPALVMLSKLPMKQAVGTSLLIIAAKSLIGFTGDIAQNADKIDWTLLSCITALAIIGIFIGNKLSKKVNGEALKKGFGWFVLVMGIYIIVKELVFPGSSGH
ncbi:MAG: sulfite exporter TauE/SafE family protein [Flavobacteriales bacterium]